MIKRDEKEGEVKDDAQVLGLATWWMVVLLLRQSTEKRARAEGEDTLNLRYSWVIQYKFPIAIGYWIKTRRQIKRS